MSKKTRTEGKEGKKPGKRTAIVLEAVSAASLKASSATNYWRGEAILFFN